MVAFLFYPLSFSYEAVQQGLELTQACIVAERGCVSLASRLMSNIGISKNLLCYSVFDAWHIRHAEVAARGQDEGKTGQLGWRIFLFSFKLAMVSFLFLFTLDLDSLDIWSKPARPLDCQQCSFRTSRSSWHRSTPFLIHQLHFSTLHMILAQTTPHFKMPLMEMLRKVTALSLWRLLVNGPTWDMLPCGSKSLVPHKSLFMVGYTHAAIFGCN